MKWISEGTESAVRLLNHPSFLEIQLPENDYEDDQNEKTINSIELELKEIKTSRIYRNKRSWRK